MITTIISIIGMLSAIVYAFSEGATEGYTWASPVGRKQNKLICGRLGDGVSKGILDYHSWRMGENIGIWGMVVSALLSPTITTAVFILAGWSLGFMFYEFALNYVTMGKWTNPNKVTYHIGGKDILRPSTWIWRKVFRNKFKKYEAFPILYPIVFVFILLVWFIFI